jgi:23S rRNA pseudouridine2604 synthase
MSEIRLNKFIASMTDISRRGADKLIEQGKVSINGRKATVGMTVNDNDEVLVDGNPLGHNTKKVILAFYKPVGVTVSKKDDHAKVLIGDIIDYPLPLTYAGRLDKDSEGLILLTNDGDLINDLMKGANHHEKEYVVKLDKKPEDGAISRLEKGVYLPELKVKTRPCKIKKISDKEFMMVITQGLNRQIRRMWALEGCKVIKLKRTRIENIKLGGLKTGQYRELSPDEETKLRSIITKN